MTEDVMAMTDTPSSHAAAELKILTTFEMFDVKSDYLQ